jgi:predicted anti-sigma-YlaC factor YlaD
MKPKRRQTVDCSEVCRYICENLDLELNSAKCMEIKAHISKCRNCTAYLDSLKKTVMLFQAYPIPPVSAATRKKLFAAISFDSAKAAR